jgi:thiol-disulfide isomerase/thioredoxin
MCQKKPKSRNIRVRLAVELAASGRRQEAEQLTAGLDPGRLLVGQPAPRFAAKLLDGTATDLGRCLHGKKALLVNFWFYRCGPCREEFPRLEELYHELRDRGLAIVALNCDDDRETVARFVRSRGWTLPIALGMTPGANSAPEAYRVDVFPTSFVIDDHGKIVARYVGWNEAAIRESLSQLGVR